MSKDGYGVNPADFKDAIYQSLIAQGVNPQDAAKIAASRVAFTNTDLTAVEYYVSKAWNMLPANLTTVQKAYYATAIVTAMRGNDGPWNYLLKNDQVFVDLFGDRKPPVEANPEDIHLAYAEHYLRERFVAGFTGDDQGARDEVRFYHDQKVKAFASGDTSIFQRTSHKPSPPTVDQLWWGLAGVLTGKRDYTKDHPGSSGIPFGTLLLEGKVIGLPKTPPDPMRAVIKQLLQRFAPKKKPNAPVTECLAADPAAVAGVPVQTMGVEVIPGPAGGA